MELSILIYVGLALIVGMVIGIGVIKQKYKSKVIGNLRVDQSIEDDNPYLFLEITRGNIDKFKNEKYVVLEVLTENYIPHE